MPPYGFDEDVTLDTTPSEQSTVQSSWLRTHATLDNHADQDDVLPISSNERTEEASGRESREKFKLKQYFANFGLKLEEIIDNSPIGIKLPEQSQNSEAPSIGDQNPPATKGAFTKDVSAAARKAGAAVGGGALIGVGVVMIPTLPPPLASLAMLGGYAVLGKEFEGPRKVVLNARDKLREDIDDDDEGDRSVSDDGNIVTVGDDLVLKEEEEAEKEPKKPSIKEKKKGRIEKATRRLSKKYVLPVLEKVCNAYEKVDQEKEDAVECTADYKQESEADASDEGKESEDEDWVDASM